MWRFITEVCKCYHSGSANVKFSNTVSEYFFIFIAEISQNPDFASLSSALWFPWPFIIVTVRAGKGVSQQLLYQREFGCRSAWRIFVSLSVWTDHSSMICFAYSFCIQCERAFNGVSWASINAFPFPLALRALCLRQSVSEDQCNHCP